MNRRLGWNWNQIVWDLVGSSDDWVLFCMKKEPLVHPYNFSFMFSLALVWKNLNPGKNAAIHFLPTILYLAHRICPDNI